ncbi:GFA family protein [uncultured Hoeflea sp.]|uniref:GFA family protein n=1 Tax=uncultured Hoeflea sp. TaxID=538666 RepID=UPI002618903A|nr:GFA family protein [uncultured Hoeflea sp.]
MVCAILIKAGLAQVWQNDGYYHFTNLWSSQTMSDKTRLTGRCMCGAVVITGTARDPKVAVCHCDMCRRWSSGPCFEVSCQEVSFEGEQHITRIRSSEWAERGFCGKCGSNLFYQIIGSDEFQISAGLLDEQDGLKLSLQVFTDRKPSYYTLADETETMTEAEMFAAYAPAPDR